MTDNKHPITPPPELVEQWECEYHHSTSGSDFAVFISEKAARWGADQELLACGNYLEKCAAWEPEDVTELYNYLCPRPKPPSLKEQALDRCNDYIDPDGIIRRALESLPN